MPFHASRWICDQVSSSISCDEINKKILKGIVFLVVKKKQDSDKSDSSEKVTEAQAIQIEVDEEKGILNELIIDKHELLGFELIVISINHGVKIILQV